MLSSAPEITSPPKNIFTGVLLPPVHSTMAEPFPKLVPQVFVLVKLPSLNPSLQHLAEHLGRNPVHVFGYPPQLVDIRIRTLRNWFAFALVPYAIG